MTKPLPLDAGGTRPAFFEEPGLDQLVSMVLELAAEVWVVRQRLEVIEAVAAQHGLPFGEEADRHVPSAAQDAQWAAARQQLFENMFRSLRMAHRPVRAGERKTDLEPPGGSTTG